MKRHYQSPFIPNRQRVQLRQEVAREKDKFFLNLLLLAVLLTAFIFTVL